MSREPMLTLFDMAARIFELERRIEVMEKIMCDQIFSPKEVKHE